MRRPARGLALAALLAGCGDPAPAGPPPWTAESAGAPHLTRLDRDGDGRASRAEYDKVAWPYQDGDVVDRDADGAISAAELVAAVAARDPQALPIAPPAPFDGRTLEQTFFPASYATRVERDLLRTLAGEVRAAAPGVPVPDDAALDAAATDPAARAAALRALQAAFGEAGLTFPPGLTE